MKNSKEFKLRKEQIRQEVSKESCEIYLYLRMEYSSLENPMDGGAWLAAVHGVMKSWTRLSDFTLTFHFHSLEKEMATH